MITFGCFLSAILFVATLTLWIASYGSNFNIQIDRTHWDKAGVSQYQVRLGRGTIILSRYAHMGRVSSLRWQTTSWRDFDTFDLQRARERILGFGYQHRGWRIDAALPSWFLLVIFATLPVAEIVRRRRQKHAAAMRYTKCGYNLCGNTSGVCPECGTRVSLLNDFALRDVAKTVLE